jgi:hypothetical protein
MPYIALSRYPRRNMHFLYEPTDLEVVLGGTDIMALWPMSLCSFDWNVTHKPSQFGIWADWFGEISFAMRERG